MTSDSDSDSEQLYTKTAERVVFRSNIEDIEDVINMASKNERGKLMENLHSGMSPMEALIKVHMEQTPMSSLNKKKEAIPLQENTSTQTSPRVSTRASTRASTVASTKVPLAKAEISHVASNVEKEASSKGHCGFNEEEGLGSVESNRTKRRRKRSRPSKTRSSSLYSQEMVKPANNCDTIVLDDDTGYYNSRFDEEEGLGSVESNRTKRRRKRSRPSKTRSSSLQSQEMVEPANNFDTIVLDDDTGYYNTITNPIYFDKSYNLTPLVDQSSDSDENSFIDKEPVKLTIEWSGVKGFTRKTFTLGVYETFESVYEELAKMDGIPASKVILMRFFTSIKPSDSPASLNIRFYGALTGFASSTEINYENSNSEEDEKVPDGALRVKIQLQTNEKLVFTVFKRSTMDFLYGMLSTKLKCAKDKLKLYYDGEYMTPTEKFPSDIEEGDMFTAHIKM